MYVRIKFNDSIGNASWSSTFSDGTTNRTIANWVERFLEGSDAANELPTDMVDVNLTTRVGSLPSEYTITQSTYTGTSTSSRYLNNYFRIQKAHSQNSNFSSLLTIYQNMFHSSGVFQPRYSSNNNTNVRPDSIDTDSSWFLANTTDDAQSYGPRYFGGLEMQFFISEHWFIWSVTDTDGSGGSAGLFDVESTGLDTYARNLNTLYAPQFFVSAWGDQWPTATADQVAEPSAYSYRTAIYANQMYGGGSTFVNRGAVRTWQNAGQGYGTEDICLFPNPQDSIFNAVDDIGDTQNFLVPVYFYPTNHKNTNNSDSDRILLQGRVPYLWRTSDNAGQTGQTATIGGVEYRFVRLHSCGGISTSDTANAATYMVPTTIGGV